MEKTRKSKKTSKAVQIQNDYAKIMRGFIDNPLFQNTGEIDPNVHFEQFSIYDKNTTSKATTITFL